MKKIFTIYLILFVHYTQAQLISSFSWDQGPVTKATFGPDAISVGSSSRLSPIDDQGAIGLNPGSPKRDIDLVLDGSAFNVEGLDVSILFRREESVAYFFQRGSHFTFGISGGSLFVRFRLKNEDGSFEEIQSGSIQTVPFDDVFHAYQFVYDPNQGMANVYVDGQSVYQYIGGTGRVMHWNTSENMVIGAKSDASGRNVPIYDNARINQIVYNPVLPPLPISLLSFEGEVQNEEVVLQWQTLTELYTDYFVIERSANGKDWAPIGRVAAAGNSNELLAYTLVDATPLEGLQYYRLVEFDQSGKRYEYTIIDVNVETAPVATITQPICYPNPVVGGNTLQVKFTEEMATTVVLYDMQGNLLQKQVVEASQVSLKMPTQRGVYLVKVISEQVNHTEKIIVN
ncbi:MAG: T9SS type A sorting domain-containing protein [Thermonemataceae bacterium]